MKKILVSVIVLVLVLASCLAIFAACSKSDYDHVIVFYSSQGQDLGIVTENAIAAFEAKYPGWKVEHTRVGGYDDVRDKIMTDNTGGTYPDLAYCYADHVALYLPKGNVVDLNKYFTSDASYSYTADDGKEIKIDRIGFTAEEKADFVQGYLSEGYASNFSNVPSQYDANALFTVPFVKSTELMYVNETALKAMKADVPTTWDELWALGPKVAARYPTATLLGYDSEANWFITACEQNGWKYTSTEDGNHYQFDNAQTRAWLEKLQGYYDLGYITTQEDYGAYTSGLFTKGADDGGLIFCIGSSGGASHQDPAGAFEYGIYPIPGVDATHNQCISQGPSLVMFSGGHGVTNASEKEIMTWLFMKELLDPTFLSAFAQASGYNPPRQSVYELEGYQEFLSETKAAARAAKVALELNARFFTSPAFEGSATARNQVGNALLAAIKGIRTPAEALAAAVKNCGGNSK